MAKKLILTVLVLFSAIQVCSADNNSGMSFVSLLGEKRIVSRSAVTEMMQDSRGYLWLGSLDGLVRFDGSSYKLFKSNDLDLTSCAISRVFEDSKGNVWVGTESGLCRFDIKAGRFVPIVAVADNGVRIDSKVNDIIEDGNGLIWISLKSKGVCSYNPKSGKLMNFLYDPKSGVIPPKIQNIRIDSKGNFLFTVYFDGLYSCSEDFSKLEKVDVSNLDFSDDNITDFFFADNGTLYLSSSKFGLCELFLSSGKVNILIPKEDGDFYARDICHGNSSIYLATNKGLYIYDLKFRTYSVHNLENTPGLKDYAVNSVILDSSGAILLGGDFGRVYYSSPESHRIALYDTFDNGQRISRSFVRSFAEDDDGVVWITSSTGILRLDPSTGSLTNNAIKGIESAYGIAFSDGKLWVGTSPYLYRFDTRTKHIDRFDSEQVGAWSMSDRAIYPIFRMSSGRLLLGHALGIVEYSSQTNTFSALPGLDEFNVNSIAEENDSTIWLSTYAHGLLKYNMSSMNLMPYEGEDSEWILRNKRLNDVYMDSSKRIWVASNEDGCLVIDRAGNMFNVNKESTFNVLPSDNISSICEDFNGNIWLSTDMGLMSVSHDLKSFSRYNELDGLLSDYFFKRSSFRGFDGTMYLGSYEGFISFNSKDECTEGTRVPGLYISDMEILGKSLMFDKDSPIADVNVDLAEKIVLSHNQNTISFSFSTPCLPSGSTGYILCKLDGIDKDWHQPYAENIASWRDLPGGRYKLHISSYSYDGILQEEHKPLTIIIRNRPLWSVAARITYALILMLISVFAVRKIYLHFLDKETNRQRELIESQIANTPERKLLRAAQIGMSVYTVLAGELKDGDKKFLGKIDNIIEEKITDSNLSYGIVATALCMGKQSLNLKFKALLGITVNDYIRLTRLCRSVKMLTEDDVRVNEVCYSVGFNTPSYFAKCFKNAFGMLPAEYQEQFRT